MKKSIFPIVLILLFTAIFPAMSQDHSDALEGIIVERYYISDANDATDTDGGSLVSGSITYRIFVDMKEGYNLQAVFGDLAHELGIETTTEFFNNEDRGETTGDQMKPNYLDDNTVALDSWLSLGAATEDHFGIPKTEDTDGSVVGGNNNDGGSEGVSGGLLVNADSCSGIPLTTADGLIDSIPPEITLVGLDLAVFGDENAGPSFITSDGAWAVLGGVKGPTAENKVLIAQITTDGELSCRLNIQMGIIDAPGPINVVQFVYDMQPEDTLATEYYIYECPELSFIADPCDPQEIGDPVFIHELNIYPNPAKDQINLVFETNTKSTGCFSIYDSYGKKHLAIKFADISADRKETIDISNLSPGIYIVEFAIDGINSYGRMVKY